MGEESLKRAVQSLSCVRLFFDLMDCSMPAGSSVHGILLARVLEWVIISFSNKESWVSKNWCFWTVMLEKTLESPLDSKEIQPVSPEGNQSWIFIGRTHDEAGAPILWPPDTNNKHTRNEPDNGKIEVRRRRGWQRMRWLDDITNSMDMSLSKLWWMMKTWHATSHWVARSQTRLSNQTM